MFLKQWAAGSVLLCVAFAAKAASQQTPVVRWAEGQPGCVFQAGDDGTYRYGLATDDFSITLAMDTQELEKARRRAEPVLGLFLSVRWLKQNHSQLAQDKITLEFVQHFHEKEAPLDSARLVAELQAQDKKDAEAAAQEIRKHSGKKTEIEADLEAQRENTAEMVEWLRTKTMQRAPATDGIASGWLLFAAKGRWMGELRRQEELVLRVPLGDVIGEFPFTLPPSQGDIRLRKRPGQ